MTVSSKNRCQRHSARSRRNIQASEKKTSFKKASRANGCSGRKAKIYLARTSISVCGDSKARQCACRSNACSTASRIVSKTIKRYYRTYSIFLGSFSCSKKLINKMQICVRFCCSMRKLRSCASLWTKIRIASTHLFRQ